MNKKKEKYLFLLLLIMLGFTSNKFSAQVKNPVQYNVATDSASHSVIINFQANEEIGNLVVLIHDDAGQTVFLENRYKFLGYYNKTIPVIAKGVFHLQIINDDLKFQKKLTLK